MIETPYDDCRYVKTIEIDIHSYVDKSFFLHYPDFAFRGQTNYKWTVVPSLYRLSEEDCRKYIRGIANTTKCPSTFNEKLFPLIEYTEKMILKRFYDLSNQQGLYLPTPNSKWMNGPIFNILNNWETDSFSQYEIKQIASLAQHYGCPTRLLDWTCDFDTAGYFATQPKNDNKRAEYCVIWAINLRLIDFLIDIEKMDNDNKMELITPQYYNNRYISAQRGLFTLLPQKEIDVIRYVNKICEKNGKNTEDFIKMFGGAMPIYQYLISRKNADEIFQELVQRGNDANRYFPGYAGVTQSIKESTNAISITSRYHE